MKKIIALITLIVCCFSLFACKKNQDAPGLYDAKGRMVASWEELTDEYGLNIHKVHSDDSDKSSLYYIVTNNEELANGVKLVIDGDTEVQIGARAFEGCSFLESVIIPTNIKWIGREAFSECTSLVSVVIPEGIEIIDLGVFYGCTSLESVTIPTTVTTIDGSAFYTCSSLLSVELPDGLTSIYGLGFAGCASLEEIEIPSSVVTISDGAFAECSSLTSITFKGTVEQWKAITLGEIWNLNVPATEVVCSDGTVPLK